MQVSTVDQNEEIQIQALEKHNIDKWFIERVSGKDTNRPQLKAMLEFAREGDTLYIHDLLRLGRKTEDLLRITGQLQDKGINLVSNKESIDTSTATGKLMFTMIAAIAEFERANLKERQREGIAIAKQKGKYKGRKEVSIDKNLFDEQMKRYDPKADTSIPNTFKEWGELPVERPGERTDLALLYQFIKDGLSNFEIMERNPNYLLNLEKIERARQAVREQEYRNTFRPLNVTYIWGKTGTGKTRSVMEKFSYSGVYRVTDYTHPFDSYNGEDLLLLDEYSSNFRVRDLLNYLDGYPLNLPCRYTNRVACYTKVYIISNLCLTRQYPDVQFESPATFDALLRRIHRVVCYTAPGQFLEYDTADYMDNPFITERGRR